MSVIKFRTPGSISPLDSLLHDFFEGEFIPRAASNHKFGSIPATNIREDEGNFFIELAAPGMKKDDFKIELNENLLTIRSEKKDINDERKDRFTKREFNYSSFVRSFRLPEHVNLEAINANYADGILILEIPRIEVEQKVKVRQIAIS